MAGSDIMSRTQYALADEGRRQLTELVRGAVEDLFRPFVCPLSPEHRSFGGSGTRLLGRRTGREFTVGDEVRVKVEKVDMEMKQIDFIIFPAEK